MGCFRVVGHPISHSLSPLIHSEFARQADIEIDYQICELPKEDFASNARALFDSGVSGLSVSLPFKRAAYEMAEIKTAYADRAQSANTLWVREGKIHGDNTDGRGLVQDLTDNQKMSLSGKRVLIIGAGGATLGIVGPLLDAGALITVINRTPLAEDHPLRREPVEIIDFVGFSSEDARFDLVINATSAGLAGEIHWPFTSILPGAVAYDLSYTRSHETPFTQWALAFGAAKAVDGFGMLVQQAALQFEIFNGVRVRTEGLEIGENGRVNGLK